MPNNGVCVSTFVCMRACVCGVLYFNGLRASFLLFKLMCSSSELIARWLGCTNEIRTQSENPWKIDEVHFFPYCFPFLFFHWIFFLFRRMHCHILPSVRVFMHPIENSLLSRAHSYLPKVVNYKLMWLSQKWRNFAPVCLFK